MKRTTITSKIMMHLNEKMQFELSKFSDIKPLGMLFGAFAFITNANESFYHFKNTLRLMQAKWHPGLTHRSNCISHTRACVSNILWTAEDLRDTENARVNSRPRLRTAEAL